MEASILDLRYKMKDVLSALQRREDIKILYHGKWVGTITPAQKAVKQSVSQHPLFGSDVKAKTSVEQQMMELRKGRFHDF